MDTNTPIIHSKPHFEVLDGLRGVAALAVVIFHFMEWVYTDPPKNFIGHGFLAVDLFFCLSGFVIGYAYDDRMADIGVLAFFKARIIRLHPLVILGSVLGLLAFLLDPFGGHPEAYSSGKIILAFVCSLLLIPLPVIADRGFNLFSFNAPSWSLFWEYVANIVYALVLWRLDRRYLVVMALLSAGLLVGVAYRSGNLLGGWSGPTFWDGGARIAYSFTAGLLIFRYKLIIRNKLPFIVIAVLLFLAFISPHTQFNSLTELLIVLFYFPLIIMIGAGAVITNRTKACCTFLGDISYPFYMTHYAVMWMFGNYYLAHHPSMSILAMIIPVTTTLLIGIAYLVMIKYDRPFRNYLNRKFMGRR
ncbi:acyltransferase [Mucilaginibacter daejeonensis]|uniref:acyltransferase family protein n=1 Tax=Mucilaginibacter daejeonensis TaxID=398049 RepID=UPI001D178E9A|nr:acyltransferase [Mucilaginibacter daejeonensis]UEG55174.1 acyltransferase [Mucilaginibacter daejeonensis]